MRLGLKYVTRPGIPGTSRECHASGWARERLLRAACNAGLEPWTVIDVAEAVTGCPWACLGAPEITTVARELLSAAKRVAHDPGRGPHLCAR